MLLSNLDEITDAVKRQSGRKVKMALTRDFNETVAARLHKDPTFAQALLGEAITLFVNGESESVKYIIAPFYTFYERISHRTNPRLVVFVAFNLAVFVVFYDRRLQPIGEIAFLQTLNLLDEQFLNFFQSLSLTRATRHDETRIIRQIHRTRRRIQHFLLLH